MNNIKFPYYPSNVHVTTPLGYVTLEDFVRANKNPNKKMQNFQNKNFPRKKKPVKKYFE